MMFKKTIQFQRVLYYTSEPEVMPIFKTDAKRRIKFVSLPCLLFFPLRLARVLQPGTRLFHFKNFVIRTHINSSPASTLVSNEFKFLSVSGTLKRAGDAKKFEFIAN